MVSPQTISEIIKMEKNKYASTLFENLIVEVANAKGIFDHRKNNRKIFEELVYDLKVNDYRISYNLIIRKYLKFFERIRDCFEEYYNKNREFGKGNC